MREGMGLDKRRKGKGRRERNKRWDREKGKKEKKMVNKIRNGGRAHRRKEGL